MAKAEFYVIFDAEVRGGKVHQVRAQRLTKNPPSLGGGEIANRFVVDIPDKAFLRLVPTVEVDLPEDFWTSQPMVVVIPPPED